MALVPVAAHAAGPVEHSDARLPLNLTAIAIFCGFVVLTLAITWWASKRTRTANDFLTAGGNITGFQNGLAIAGDAVSSATVLGLVSFIYSTGYDGFVSSVGFFVGWPLLLLLMADRLRNLGRFTFADIISLSCSPSLDQSVGPLPECRGQVGPCVPDRLTSVIGGLLPIALCGRTSL